MSSSDQIPVPARRRDVRRFGVHVPALRPDMRRALPVIVPVAAGAAVVIALAFASIASDERGWPAPV